MGYLIKATLGLALFLGGIALFNVKLISLLETGTCASGNTPYQISKPCPSGTGTDILLLMGSLLGAGIGGLLFVNRGDPPGGRKPLDLEGDFTFGVAAWGLFFTATGATSLYGSLTNEAIKASGGGQLGGIIVGATFLLMGIPAVVISVRSLIRDLRTRGQRPRTVTAETTGSSASPSSGWSRMTSGFDVSEAVKSLPWVSAGGGSAGGTGDQIAKLERLQRLHESGALTDSEFEQEKAKILSE
jgi:putative oligomerization/nucleic acid binding protein